MAGRKAAHYEAKDGTQIKGLARRPSDGRWRVIGTNVTFTCDDEALAIHKFHTLYAALGRQTVDLLVEKPKPGTPVEQMPILSTWDPAKGTMTQHLSEAALWSYVRDEILRRPLYVAQVTGIEQIGYLTNLTKPTPPPTLDEVGQLYLTHAKVSPNWRSKSKAFWAEFQSIVKKPTLRDVDQEDLVNYADAVKGAAKRPAYVRQRFGAVKAILNYTLERGKWAEHSQRVLAFCGVLVPPKRALPDPKPIAVGDFAALYRAADEQMKALLLVALNCCLYAGEAAALRWDDFDLTAGVLAGARGKTGILRVAVLWPETIEALRRLSSGSPAVFVTASGSQADYLSIQRRFLAVRKAAKRPKVQLAQIRDGAYTAAIQAGVPLDQCRLLAGHASGISDAYVLRLPKMVAPACEAVRSAYRVKSLAKSGG